MLTRALNLKQKLRNGDVVFGAWHTIPELSAVEAIADAGLDFVIIDAEHSPWTIERLQQALLAFRGSQTVPMARIPWNEPIYIKQALDAGLEGIMAPMVRNAAEARALVEACHYPPVGSRGFGPRRASGYFRDIDGYMANVYDAIFVMPQIEDYKSAALIDEILDVPGIDGIAIGPTDMSGTLGLLRQTAHPQVTEHLDQILSRSKARGVPVCNGLALDTADQATWIAKGARMVLISQDISILVNETARLLTAARQAAGLVAEPKARASY